jgi:glycosyltransferase involved in cell wall biosynthesis
MGCIGEILDNSGAFLYDPNLEEGLFQAMNRAVENSAELLCMGEYNQQSADQWSWNHVAEKTLNVYKWCLSQ